MTNVILAAVLQLSVAAANTDSYSTAREETAKTGRPMIVLVGADWCPACVDMKENVMPQVKRRGLLKKVTFAVVNLDREKALGRQLTNGGPIPQIIMFRKSDDGWRRRKLIGGQDVASIEEFIEEGVRLDAKNQKEKTQTKSKSASATASKKDKTT